MAATPEIRRRWLENNREKARAQRRAWAARNPEKVAQIDKDYRALNWIKISLQRSILMALRRKGGDADVEYVLALLDEQGGVCALSGLSFTPNEDKGMPGPYSPSLDRIDHRLPYDRGNLRIILFCLNSFRGRMGDEDMLAIAWAMVERAACQ